MKVAAITLFLFFILFLAGCSERAAEAPEMKELEVTSTAFQNNANVPEKYSCDGENVNPPLHIENIPDGTRTLVLIVDDPDAPGGSWVHWVVFDIPPASLIEENSVPGTEGTGSSQKNSYSGPCPPSGTHRYFFKVYALDSDLGLGSGATKADVEKAMQNHILARGELVGLYSRDSRG